MNDDSRVIASPYLYDAEEQIAEVHKNSVSPRPPTIPDYLQETYWWAYLHPKSLWFFEREWVVNFILWGNMRKLTDAVLEGMQLQSHSRVLQVACVYGDFSNRLASYLKQTSSTLSIVDVTPMQLTNVEDKLAKHDNYSVHHHDSTQMSFADGSFEETVVFFLLHEQPEKARRKTIEEAVRVTKPGGRVIFVDYHGPHQFNPMRLLMKPILALLEPFALDLWREELSFYMPADIQPAQLSSEFYFGGLYQKVVLEL